MFLYDTHVPEFLETYSLTHKLILKKIHVY